MHLCYIIHMKLKEYTLKYKNNLPFQAELSKVTNLVPHRHDTELELVYCLEGTVHLEAADQKATLHAGQLHSIDFADIHCLWSDDDNITLIFHLDLSAMPDWDELRYVFFACESSHCYPYQQAAMEKIKDIVLSLSYMYFMTVPAARSTDLSAMHKLHNRAFAQDDLKQVLHELTHTLLQYFNWFNYENQDEYMNQDLYDRFTRILVYVIDNYKEKITVSQLASQENINRNYFSQFIGKTVFSSFSNMVNYIRCWHAEELLLTTDMPNAEISYACGFSDPKYFYAAFKDLWGCTPSEHRQQYEEYYQECLRDPVNRKHEMILPDSRAAAILRDFILQWHLTKTLC